MRENYFTLDCTTRITPKPTLLLTLIHVPPFLARLLHPSTLHTLCFLAPCRQQTPIDWEIRIWVFDESPMRYLERHIDLINSPSLTDWFLQFGILQSFFLLAPWRQQIPRRTTWFVPSKTRKKWDILHKNEYIICIYINLLPTGSVSQLMMIKGKWLEHMLMHVVCKSNQIRHIKFKWSGQITDTSYWTHKFIWQNNTNSTFL